MENIKVQKKTIKENNILKVYDIFDDDVGKSMSKKNENRNNKTAYNKIKIPNKPNQNHKFFVKLMKQLIDANDLWGNENKNELSVEYLTYNGWVGNADSFLRADRKRMFALPQHDKNHPSGEQNNALDPNEQIFIARVNVFEF